MPKTEAHTEPVTVKAVPTEDGKGHTNKVCGVCDYALGEPEAHTYIKNTNGSCDTCDFTPFMSDSEGNLYDKDSYQEAFEKAAAGEVEWLQLENKVTDPNSVGVWTKSIEFSYSGKPVTLKMNNVTLSSTGEAALVVSGGTLIIENNAALEGMNGGTGNPSTPAVKVTDGVLTFKGTVNATGGSGSSSAAPAIEVTGGKVTFEGSVNATGGLQGVSGNRLTCSPAIKATDGELDFQGSQESQVDLTLYGGLTMTGDAKLTHGLTKGLFYSKPTGASSTTGYAVSVEGSNVYKNDKLVNVNKLLADKHVFVKIGSSDENDRYLTASRDYLTWDVTIEYHEHNFDANNDYECVCGVSCDHPKYENGACTVCGKPCEHGNVDSYPTGHICRDCGQKMLVQNTFGSRDDSANFKFAYFTSLKDAMAAAEDGWTVKLLDNIDDIGYGIDIYEKNSGTQTITLDLNGKNITGSNAIWIGKPNSNIISTTTLKIVGSGDISLGGRALVVSEKSTLNLEGWTRGSIDAVSVSCNGNTGDEGSLIVGENDDVYIGRLLYQTWSLNTIAKAKLSGGTYGRIEIGLTDYRSPGILFGTLLAPGYAFQYADGSGSFVNYATKATYDEAGVISDVKVVKCTTHVDAKSVDADGNITDGADNLCDYCNADLTAATVATLTVDGKTYFYTDLPSALDKANVTKGTITIKLLKDVTGLKQQLKLGDFSSWTDNNTILDLNGKTLSGTGGEYNTFLMVNNFGTVTICDSSKDQTGLIKNTSSGDCAVCVGIGKLTITGGIFESTGDGWAASVDSGSDGLIITGGTFKGPVRVNDDLTVSGGIFERPMDVYNGSLIVNGGTFKEAVTIAVSGTEIKGGTFNGAFSMSAQPDVFSGGTFTQQAVFSSVSNILTGGEFQKGIKSTDKKLYELLAENKAYQTADDWLDDNTTYFYNDTGSSVTVVEAPIHSVTLTVNGNPVALEDKKGRFSVELGTDVTLTASCEGSMEAPYGTWSPTYGGEDGGTANPVKQGTGKSLSYTLPPEDLTVGTHTYRVSFCSENPGKVGNVTGYSEVVQITITVTKIDLANAEVTIDPWPTDGKVRFSPFYLPAASVLSIFDNTVTNKITVKANNTESELSNSDYTYEGATATQVGKYTLTITATDSCANYTGSKTFDWEVTPCQLYNPSYLGNQKYTKIYDGTTTLPESYHYYARFSYKEDKIEREVDWYNDTSESNYEVTAAEFVSPDAGKNKPINQTITLKNENFVFEPTEKINVKGITTAGKTMTYTNFTTKEGYGRDDTTFNIEKATVPDFDKEVTLDIVNDLAHTYTIDLPALPALESPRTYGEITYGQPAVQLASGYYTVGNAKVENGKLILTINKNPVTTTGSIGTVTVKVTTTNYKDVTLAVKLQAVNKQRLGMFVSVATDPIVYGMTLGEIKLSADATVDGQVIPGIIAWDDPLTTVPAAGQATYRWTFTPDDTMHYLTASNTIHFSVDKATPTGAPAYAAITTGGKTLADAALTPNASWPSGTVQWVDKDGKVLDPATTEVKANTAYQWKFTPDSKNYDPIEGSITLYYVSTGGGGSTTYPVSTPSKTENGSVSVSPKNASRGDTVTITVKPDDGYVLDDLTVTDKNGNDLKLTDKGNGKYTFTMPAGKVEVKASFAEEAETSPFADVATNAYYYEAVKWAAEQGITGGIGNNLFGPNYPCTRAQIVTFLWRAVGSPEPKSMSSFVDVSTDSYYAKAMAWAVENGITTGTGNGKFSPDATCTRAQAVTFLARALNAKATSAAEFSDVPTDSYFAEAVAWAASNGVTAGIGGGLFGPNNDCTRAQIVTFLFRAYNK